MKKTLLVALLAGVSAAQVSMAHAAQPGDEFLGTWTSPASVDTQLQIVRLDDASLQVREIHRNVFGSTSVVAKPAIARMPNRLDVGTIGYFYDPVHQVFVVPLGLSPTGSEQGATFSRIPG